MALLWTSPADVRDRWLGNPITEDDARLATLLEDVEDTILREFPDVADRIASGTFPVTRIRKVAARVVIRHLRNPEGVRQTQEGAGPFQRGVTFGSAEPGTLALSDDDRAELAAGGGSRAFTVDTSPLAVPAVPPSIDTRLWNEG